VLGPRAEHSGETRSHALRGNAVFDAPRRPAPAEGRRAAREAFPRRAWERVTRFPCYIIDLRRAAKKRPHGAFGTVIQPATSTKRPRDEISQAGGRPLHPRISFQRDEPAPPSGYGISGRCSAVAPSGPTPTGSAPLTDAASGEIPDGLRAKRKPRLNERFDGTFVKRSAVRQFAAS